MRRYRWYVSGGLAVGLCAAMACVACGQTAAPNGGGLGLDPMPRPAFGDRPKGFGFRPQPSGTRQGLLRTSGLQDAMEAARSSPLYPARSEPVAQAVDAEFTQAVQTLRTLQETRSRQLTAQASTRRRPSPLAAHAVAVQLPAPTPVDVAGVQAKLSVQLEHPTLTGVVMTVRHMGGKFVLEGSVVTETQRAVIEQLVRLEPGVYELENRLRIDLPSRQ